MSIKKNITIDGMEVPFKASAAVPRLYRLKFRRDIYKDFASLKTDVEEGDENKSELDIESLEVFENIAYIMAKHADPENVPDSPDDFLEQFLPHGFQHVQRAVMHTPVLQVAPGTFQGRQYDEGQRHIQKGRTVLPDEDVVERGLDQPCRAGRSPGNDGGS